MCYKGAAKWVPGPAMRLEDLVPLGSYQQSMATLLKSSQLTSVIATVCDAHMPQVAGFHLLAAFCNRWRWETARKPGMDTEHLASDLQLGLQLRLVSVVARVLTVNPSLLLCPCSRSETKKGRGTILVTRHCPVEMRSRSHW